MEKKIPKKCVGSDVCIGAVCLSDSAGKRISKKRAVGIKKQKQNHMMLGTLLISMAVSIMSAVIQMPEDTV